MIPQVAPQPPTAHYTPPAQEPATPLHAALGEAEQRVAQRTHDQSIAELRGTVDQLRAALEHQRHASVDDLAEAVVLLRQSGTDGAPIAGQVEYLSAQAQTVQHQLMALESLPDQVAHLTRAVDGLTGLVLDRHDADESGESSVSTQLDSMHTSMEHLARAILELRNTSAAGAATDTISGLQTSIEQAVETMLAARDETMQLIERQAKETHALRRQLTELKRHIEERREADISGESLVAQFESLRSELSRIRPDGDMVTATQLAETINTLRDSGVDDISAAHLVHTFQLEMRTLRDELKEMRADADTSAHAPNDTTTAGRDRVDA